MGTLANVEDLDEMLQNAVFHQGITVNAIFHQGIIVNAVFIRV